MVVREGVVSVVVVERSLLKMLVEKKTKRIHKKQQHKDILNSIQENDKSLLIFELFAGITISSTKKNTFEFIGTGAMSV